ncbi:MAG: protein kinase [Cyanobacteria bacterium SZAS LIN-2]|nr:protein kinase [Cyanobacteria bacterium SZAS LIN-2]
MIVADLALSRTFKVINGALQDIDMELGGAPFKGVSFEPGTIIDAKYEVLSLLGAGGMGAVYKVKHLQLNKEVALKTFRSANINEDSWLRFQREAQAIGKLDDINIVKVYDFGVSTNNLPYYTMEVLTGQSLAEKLHADGPLNQGEALGYFQTVARALLHAHKLKIIHRDIKPGNIFLCRNEATAKPTIKLVDFGIAKLISSQSLDSQRQTDSGLIFGSPLYMSPEQSLGQAVDGRSDIYSFGCALFEALTGQPPFVGSNVFATMIMHQNQKPPALADKDPAGTYGRRLESMMAKLLAKNVDLRYQSFENVLSDLNIILEDQAAENFSQSANLNTAAEPAPHTIPAARARSLEGADTFETARKQQPPIRLLIIASVVLTTLSAAAGFAFLTSMSNTKKASVAVADQSSKGDPHNSSLPHEETMAQSRKSVQPVGAYYSFILPDGRRQFRFDKGTYLGHFNTMYSDENLNNDMQAAQDTVTFKRGAAVCLTADFQLAEHPEWFDRFRPDDLTALKLDQGPEWSTVQYQHIAHLTGLHSLVVFTSKLDDSFFAIVDGMPNLTVLEIPECECTAENLRKCRSLRRLGNLRLNSVEHLSAICPILAQSNRLHTLAIEHCDLTNNDLKQLARIKNLSELRIGHNAQLTAPGLLPLADLPNLRSIYLEGLDLPPSATAILGKFKHLVEVRFNHAKWTPAQVEALQKALPPGCRIENSGQVKDEQR